MGMDVKEGKSLYWISKNNLNLMELQTGDLLGSISQADEFMLSGLAETGTEISAATFDGMVYRFDTKNFTRIGEIKGPGTSSEALLADLVYSDMKYSQNGKRLAIATLRGEIFIYQTADGRLLRKIDPLIRITTTVSSLGKWSFHRMGISLLAEYMDGRTLVAQTAGKQPVELFEGIHPSLSSNGEFLVLNTTKGIELFRTATGESITVLARNNGILGNSIFSPDDRTLVTAAAGKLDFWDVQNLVISKSIPTRFSDYQTIAVSPDSNILALGFEAQVEIREEQSGKTYFIPLTHPVSYLKFSGKGKLIAAGSKSISLLDLDLEKVISNIEISDEIKDVDVSRDGETILVVTDKGTVESYDISTSEKLTLSNLKDKFTNALFAQDDKTIIALQETNKILISTLEESGFTDYIKTTTNRSILVSMDRSKLILLELNIGEENKIITYEISTTKKVGGITTPSDVFGISMSDLLAIPGRQDQPTILSDLTGSNSCKVDSVTSFPKQVLFSFNSEFLYILDETGIVHILGIEPKME
ncbi:MAG: WD40 repeat domain-containing protein [Anaerolineales bacterium]